MITDADLLTAVQQVWTVMLGLRFEPPTATDTERVLPYTMRVRLAGNWRGEVRIAAGPVAARQLAAAVFDMAADLLDERDIADGVGEVLNIVGGNTRCVLDGPTVLGLPEVINPNDPVDVEVRTAGIAVDVGGDTVEFTAHLVPTFSSSPSNATAQVQPTTT